MEELYHEAEGLSMAIRQYLAMTAAEMTQAGSLPRHAAWMACHFSPYSTGLTNLPERLPPETLLILNDRTPIHGHEPQRILRELETVLHRCRCPGLLVDFQNPPCQESLELAEYLARQLDAPMAISPEYSAEGRGVFLPPVPTDQKAADYLKKWAGREIWLEEALEGQNITLTGQGALFTANRRQDFDLVHADGGLHCHYSIEEQPEAVVFHTWRTREDLAQLLEEAEALGVKQTVGLYQELFPAPSPAFSP